MKLSANILLIVVFFNVLINSQNLNFRWNEFPSPIKTKTVILSCESTNNFYLTDKFGNLFHFYNGEWRNYTIPEKNFAKYNWAEIAPNKFIVGCMDTKWKTHFFVFENRKWKELNFINPTPIQGIKNIANTIYIYGNFGTLLKLNNNKIIEIKSGITNHINFLESFSDSEIYLGVKAEGLYKFDGEKFSNIPFPGNKYNELASVFRIGENLYVRNHSGNYFILDIDTLRSISKINKLLKKNRLERFGFRRLLLNKNDSTKSALLPNTIHISSFRVLEDTILATSANSKIYIATISKNNFFLNMASEYNINGIPSIYSFGSAIVDLNNDIYSDIFILHNAKNYSSRIYKNIFNSPFLDFSSLSKIYKIGKISSFYFADLNSDFLPDLFTITSDSSSIWLNIYFNKNGFEFQNRYDLGRYINIRTPSLLNAIDYDKDGDLDIQLTYYYGEGAKPGKILLLENNFWGTSFNADTSLFNSTIGWNFSTINADFTGNDKNDLYLVTMWRNNEFLVGNDTGWVNETKSRFSQLPKLDTKNGIAIDYDNDGDLDIFLLTNDLRLIIYNNNGKGYFKEEQIKIELNKTWFFYNVLHTLNSGDFNNDGFTDIFISLSEPQKSENILLINDSAKQFIDRTIDFNIKTPFVNRTSIGDIDNDGDLDILGTGFGNNILWINNLNDNNYLEFILKGCKSNTEGIGAKVFIYKEGFLNDSSKIIAYKQSGSTNTVKNRQNQRRLHFGLDSKKKYDVKIRFYGGDEKVLYSVSPGKIIEIEETTGFPKTLSSVPRIIFQTIINKSIQIYALLVVLGFGLLFFETNYAIKNYKLHTLLTTTLIVSHSSFYYLLLFLASSNDNYFTKYLLPVLVLIAIILFTNLVFTLINKFQGSSDKNEEDYWNNLLNRIMHFSHGKWALRNLNSLHLFCSNPLDEYDKEYVLQFNNRRKTFLNSTAVAINEIVLLLNKINNSNETIENINILNNSLITELSNLQNLSPLQNIKLETISGNFQQLMYSISELKRIVFRRFSCNIEEIAESILQTFQPTIEKMNIKFKIISDLSDKKYALIYNHELIDILDNSINNSIVSTKNCEEIRYITIKLYNKVPHICIDIIDNGKGISKDKWEKIFEKGYTENNGTGLGLHFAKLILNKYGGQIFVKESEIDVGTIFTIEMIEGIKNAETGFINN